MSNSYGDPVTVLTPSAYMDIRVPPQSPAPAPNNPADTATIQSPPPKPPSLPPGIVDYDPIVNALRRSARIRWSQNLSATRRSSWELALVTVTEKVRLALQFKVIHVKGARQSGQSTYLSRAFLRQWTKSVLIVANEVSAADAKQRLLAFVKQREGRQPWLGRIYTFAEYAKLATPVSLTPEERRCLTIVVDPNETNPASVLKDCVAAYRGIQARLKAATPTAASALADVEHVWIDNGVHLGDPQRFIKELISVAAAAGIFPEYTIIG